jgi:hypothetical protein
VPIYSIESWLALRFKDQKLYLEVAREAYEGYVIYNFFSLLLVFCGGAEHLRRLLLEKAAVTGQSRAHMLFPLCWTRGWRLTTGEFVARCRLGVFQYTFVRTFLADPSAELPVECAARVLNPSFDAPPALLSRYWGTEDLYD